MALVVVQHRGPRGPVPEWMVAKLVKQLPWIVAEALDVEKNPDARIISNEIEVCVRESGELDINTKDLEIIIWANSYPERLANLEQRKDEILQDVRKFLGDHDRNLTGFVWVLLQPAAFGEL